MTVTLGEVVAALEARYDPALAEDWDAVGLVHGDPAQPVRRVMFAVDPALAAAADDESHDEAIRVSMKDALDATGEDAGTPIVVFAGERRTGFFGPIFSPAPTGEEALRVWDGLAALAGVSGFYELKRTRTVGPEFGPRP